MDGEARRDATAGNLLALKHGANSSRLVSEGAAKVFAELVELYPWLVECDGLTLDVLCRAKWQHDQIADFIEGVITGTVQARARKGFPRIGIEAVADTLWQQQSRAARTVIEAAGKLGFSAVDRAQLLKDTGLARHFGGDRIASLVEQGRHLRLASGNGDPVTA